MSISKEYQNQNNWRNWESYLNKISFKNSDTVLDLGCSLGFVTKIIATRVNKVLGIDINETFINKAKELNPAKNINYYNSDLRDLSALSLPQADVIWTSFVAAYFPDLQPTLQHWGSFLKPGGLIALTEINDLFGHYPLNNNYHKLINEYYIRQRESQIYDFEMGSKLKKFLINSDFQIEIEEEVYELEFSFNGSAKPLILKAWENRLDRMTGIQNFFGENQFNSFKRDFLNCLSDEKHISNTKVNFLVAKKT